MRLASSTLPTPSNPPQHPSQPTTSTDISCFQCGNAVIPTRLASHIRRRHPNLTLSHERLQQLGLVSCPECRQVFSASRGLAAHIRACRRATLPEHTQEPTQTSLALTVPLTPSIRLPASELSATQTHPALLEITAPAASDTTWATIAQLLTSTPAEPLSIVSSTITEPARSSTGPLETDSPSTTETSLPTNPASATPAPGQPHDLCMNCDEPAIPWPCCGGATVCTSCTRQARNSIPQESYSFPHPRCPSCRADYPRDFDFTLLFCRVCTQPTEPLPDFTTRSATDCGVVSTHRMPAIRDVNDDWRATACCGGRVHNACISSLTPWGSCPLCIDDHCSECHRDCNRTACRPRLRTEPSSEETIYDRCQNPPLYHRVCGHASCLRHSTRQTCQACDDVVAPAVAAAPSDFSDNEIPDDSPAVRPVSPAYSEGDYPVYRTFPYASDLAGCLCGGMRNLFECTGCGPLPIPAGDFDVHITDLFTALHADHPFFLDAMVGQLHGALNAVSRMSSICPACGSAASKLNPDSPACDAMICTLCNIHFCFYCESRVPDRYELPGHGPHYTEIVFDRPVAVRNGWCSRRRERPLPNTTRPLPSSSISTIVAPYQRAEERDIFDQPRITSVALTIPSVAPILQPPTSTAPTPVFFIPPLLPVFGDLNPQPRDASIASTATPVPILSTGGTPLALSTLPTSSASTPSRVSTVSGVPNSTCPFSTTSTASVVSSAPAVSSLAQSELRSSMDPSARAPVMTPRSRQNRRSVPSSSNQRTPRPPTLATSVPRPVPQQSAPPRRVRVLSYVPKNLWALFQDVCRPILADIERAAACNNIPQLDQLLKEFLEVPAHTLSVRRGGRRLESAVSSQLRSTIFRRSQVPAQAPRVEPQASPAVPPSTIQLPIEVPAPSRDLTPQVIRRAVGLTLSNHASRATRAIYQDALPDVTPAIEEELLRLHPPATATAIPALPPNAPIIPVLGDDRFVRIWKKKVANGAAPGVSGFTGDHGLPLLEDTHCLRGLSLVIQLIRNGQLSDQARGYLLSCPVIPTAKHSGGIRPVTIGETLYKMAACLALCDVQEDAVELLGPDQFALLPGGPESATLSLKAALETCTGVSTDIANAFNSLDRGLMLTALFSHPALAPVWRLAHWVYNQPVQLQLFSSTGQFLRFLTASCGPLQGEPFSTFLYCLTVKPLIDEAKRVGGPDVQVVALTDDVNFIGPADGEAVTRAVRSYEAGSARYNLRFQARKSTFVAFHGQPLSPELLAFAAEKQMAVETRCCTIGGTPMGPDRARVQQEALKIAEKSGRFFRALQHEGMTAPVADRLLRLCGVPRIQFLSRVGLLSEYEEALAFFDAQVSTAARIQAGLQDEKEHSVIAQQEAPLRHGGFAFKAYTDNIALFASIGAVATSAAYLRRFCPHGLPPRFGESIVRTIALIRERIDEESATRLLPPPFATADECLLFFTEDTAGKVAAIKLQKTLSAAAALKVSDALLASASPIDAARFFACTAPYASSWLVDPFLAQPMRDEAHGAACKLRLNQPISTIARCFCGESLETDPWHVLSHKGGGEAGRRHDEIVNRLVEAIQRAGGQAWSEPRQNFWVDRRRTDIFAVLGPKSYHIDVRVTHPTSRSYVEVACQGSLRAANVAAQEKKRQYGAMASAEGAEFVPFIVETYGGFGVDARDFMSELAKFASLTSQVWSASETRHLVRTEIHRALFEGNLRVANAVLQQSNPIRYASGRYHAVPPRPLLVSPQEDLDFDDDASPQVVTTSLANSSNPISQASPSAVAPVVTSLSPPRTTSSTVNGTSSVNTSTATSTATTSTTTIASGTGTNNLASSRTSRDNTSTGATAAFSTPTSTATPSSTTIASGPGANNLPSSRSSRDTSYTVPATSTTTSTTSTSATSAITIASGAGTNNLASSRTSRDSALSFLNSLTITEQHGECAPNAIGRSSNSNSNRHRTQRDRSEQVRLTNRRRANSRSTVSTRDSRRGRSPPRRHRSRTPDRIRTAATEARPPRYSRLRSTRGSLDTFPIDLQWRY
jgi:hypothetical protein